VNPAYQGKGVASSLVRSVIESARSSRLLGIMTETGHENTAAQALYEKMGFGRVENPSFDGITYQLVFDKSERF
jgi:ribosomal protein S18 acetylase RimI-like enzyme